MENYNNEIFGFGTGSNENNEQIANFNYDSISGLGQSDYENEDLFSTEVENNNTSIFDNYYNQEPVNVANEVNNIGVNYIENNELVNQFSNEVYNENPFIHNFGISNNPNIEEDLTVQEEFNNTVQSDGLENDSFEDFVNDSQIIEEDVPKMNFDPMTGEPINTIEFEKKSEEKPAIDSTLQIPDVENEFKAPVFEEPIQVFETPVNTVTSDVPELSQANVESASVPVETEALVFEDPVLPFPEYLKEDEEADGEELTTQQPPVLETPVTEEQPVAPVEPEIPEEKIEISDTPIDELNKLTEYEEERIEETDINTLFDKVSVNFKDASDIFRRNSDLKRKIDTRFEELKKLQSELENARKKQLDEINQYKIEVLDKLTEKKEEIERRLNVLKESQATFEREKKEFEEYRKKEQENIDRVQKEVQSAYDDRREELNHIEDVLRKQKDSLDEERNQLSLDKIQYESDKNELANNLLKFNELVNSFTNGVNDIQG